MKNKVLVASLLAFAAVAALISAEVIEEIVAIVNDDVITLSEYKENHDSVYQAMRAQLQGEEFEKQYNRFKAELMETMITDILLLQKAKDKQLDVSNELKMYIENLKKQNNIESDEQLRQELLRQGMSYEQFLKRVEENLLRQALLVSEVDRTLVVDESEIIEYYKVHSTEFVEPEEYKLRAIYFSPEERGQDELDALKNEIGGRVKAGEDFAALAGEYSDNPLKENKGDLGQFKKGDLDKTLEQAVAVLKTGEVTPWILAKAGWYLIKLEEKKDSRLKSFDEVKKDIGERLFYQRRNKKIDEFLKEIRSKSYIKILKPNPLNL